MFVQSPGSGVTFTEERLAYTEKWLGSAHFLGELLSQLDWGCCPLHVEVLDGRCHWMPDQQSWSQGHYPSMLAMCPALG